MLVAEYSYEEDIQVKQQEALQQGVKQGIQQGVKQGIQQGVQNGMILSGQIFQSVKKNPEFTDRQIAEAVGCEEEQVRSVRKMFDI